MKKAKQAKPVDADAEKKGLVAAARAAAKAAKAAASAAAQQASTTGIAGLKVAIDGTFPGLTKQDVQVLVVSHGATLVPPKQANVLLAGDGAKKLAAGQPVVTIDALGAPLEGWLDRFRTIVAELKRANVHNFAVGPGADAAQLGRISKLVGFALPDDFTRLARTFSGLTFVHAASGKKLDAPADKLIPWKRFLSAKDPIHTTFGRATLSAIAIPPWEDMFFDQPGRERIFGTLDRTMKLGDKTISAKDFAARVFPFDTYHPSSATALYADPVARRFFILHTQDAFADMEVSAPIPLWLYVESLLAIPRSSYMNQLSNAPGYRRLCRPYPQSQLALSRTHEMPGAPFPMLAMPQ